MKGMEINFSLDSPQRKGEKIEINVDSKIENLLYKFFIGVDGVWSTLQDFSESNKYSWIPERDGKYIIMVQGRLKNSKKAFDYVTRADYIVGVDDESLIKDVYLNKEDYSVGDKINISVDTYRIPLLFKYWLRINDGWELMKNYCLENNLNFTANTGGVYDILIECKEVDSKNNFDDFKRISFKVKDIDNIEIKDFKCISPQIMVGEELVFKVDSENEKDRMLLYKFHKIDSKGNVRCIQDFSTKNLISYVEKEKGEYKLLCMVKDMYSPREYDDRALINYEVEPYKKVKIKEFTSDLNSPQLIDTEVNLKVIAEGGKKLLYRFIIEGNESKDTGYLRENNFIWKCTLEGNYLIRAMVKDISYDGEYEEIREIEYSINKKSSIPVIIKDIKLEGDRYHLINETINIKVEAQGGLDLKYAFIVYKEEKQVELIEYGDCNWVNFTPEEIGEYELEIRVKDKYSQKEYDCHSILTFNIKEYIPGNIDYVLLNSKEYYMVGDDINLEVISENTKDILIKYILRVDEHLVEETDFIKSKKYIFTPRCSGTYSIEIQGKNKRCKEGYDSKKQIKIKVHDTLPIINTKLTIDKTYIYINEPITLTVQNEGGRDVCYEFYIMEQGEWRRVQAYSKKNYYGFIPFIEGSYKVLVLTKSSHKKCAYEDYDIFEFEAYEEMKTPKSIVDYAL
ncbi:triple tyrosine motif-containing protein [Clostridium sp. MSJ-4]|uniref:Triple tyrosine motif-containing protein n=1 Tax=Clostridium simiarum TaxID=2841506 RepID=A0ABS6F0Y5_9CLOT|nr:MULTISPECIES: triple tyrosine motif-containing protein [Clostridium]MBU5592060.1 triple tyrosine motif-containing protein [Clostridium simiarum]